MKTLVAALVFSGVFAALIARSGFSPGRQEASTNSSLLARHYVEGEKLSYQMKATNEDRGRTQSYEVQADGVVKKDSAGKFYEEYEWSGLVLNGQAVPITAANADFRQVLSLDPGFKFPIPDMRIMSPGLVGPVLDFMTFYVDLGMAIRHGLNRPGEHVYVRFGRPSSWAAGKGAILGESSIDFDLTLQNVDRAAGTATILVRHVPPAQSQVPLPAAWMRTPVVDTPNNWVSVRKGSNGKYVAAVGKETFDDVIQISLTDGRVLPATMDNPVEVLERECGDAALTACGPATRYQIRRRITVQ